MSPGPALYCQLSSSSITGNKFRCSEEEIKPRPQRKSLTSTALLLLIYHRPLGPPPGSASGSWKFHPKLMVMRRTMVFDGVSWWLIAAAKMPNCLKPQSFQSPDIQRHVPMTQWPLKSHCQSYDSYGCMFHPRYSTVRDYISFLEYWSFTNLIERKFLTAKRGSIEPSVCKSMLLVHHPHASRWASPLRPSPQAIDRDLWATCLGQYVFNSSL